jgi:hypothetical protein
MGSPSYALAHEARKKQKEPENKSRIVIEGIDEPKEKQDPMTGVTTPGRLLKSDTQRIDKNVIDPYSKDYGKRPGVNEPVSKV